MKRMLLLICFLQSLLHAQNISIGYNYGIASLIKKPKACHYNKTRNPSAEAYKSIELRIFSSKKWGLSFAIAGSMWTFPNAINNYEQNYKLEDVQVSSLQIQPGVVYNRTQSLHLILSFYNNFFVGNDNFNYNEAVKSNYKNLGINTVISYEPLRNFLEKKKIVNYSLALNVKAEIALLHYIENVNYLPYSISIGASLTFR